MRIQRYLFAVLFFLLALQLAHGQKGFRFFDDNKKYEDISFKLINNLIVIPLEINGKKLSFIMDTGVNKTIVFNSAQADTVFLRKNDTYKLRGLGTGNAVDAIISKNNRFRIKDLISHNQSVYIILKDNFDLSAKMGITIHGVIGYDLLKNLVVEINYRKKRMRLYDPKHFQYKKCRKCETFPLTIYQNKPYIDVEVKIDEQGAKTPVKMLIDSGGSDAIWLFEYTKENIVTPEKYFVDFLGVGLSGTIYGKRSRISTLELGDYTVQKPTVSFLDSISTQNARRFRERNGSIGSNILKRFKVWIDYPNKQFTIEKNGSLSGGFEYNMSGIEVVYNGKVLIQQRISSFGTNYGRSNNSSSTASNSVSLVTSYQFKFKPSFRINNVLKGSPADLAGIRKNDIIMKINGKNAYDFTLSEIVAKFRRKPEAKIKLEIMRNDQIMTFVFRLKKIV